MNTVFTSTCTAAAGIYTLSLHDALPICGTSSSVGVSTAGTTTFNDNTTLSGTYNDAGFAAVGTTTLVGATTAHASASAITLTGTVNGAQALTLNSTGTTTLTGAVGTGTA